MEEEKEVMTLVTAHTEGSKRYDATVVHRPDPDMPMVIQMHNGQKLVLLSHEVLALARRLRVERRKKKLRVLWERVMGWGL